jgi:PTS system nitrogen regulatory IIA component
LIKIKKTPSLEKLLPPERIIDLKTKRKEVVLAELINLIKKSPMVSQPQEFEQAIIEREKTLSTGIGWGVALPHARVKGIKDFVLALARVKEGVEYHSLDGKPVYIIIMIGGAEEAKDEYLKLLARLTRLLKDKVFRDKIMMAKSSDEICQLFKNK